MDTRDYFLFSTKLFLFSTKFGEKECEHWSRRKSIPCLIEKYYFCTSPQVYRGDDNYCNKNFAFVRFIKKLLHKFQSQNLQMYTEVK